MVRQIFSFDPPERFVAGTVGAPGERTFFLQASGASGVVSVALEKAQVAVLAERLGELLDEVRRRGAQVPAEAPADLQDLGPLETPVEEEFRVATLALAWDPTDERVVIEAMAAVPGDPEKPTDPAALLADDDGPDLLRVRITAESARAFVARAASVVAAGRPPCPLCGRPLDPTGHVCARLNGHLHG